MMEGRMMELLRRVFRWLLDYSAPPLVLPRGVVK